MGIIVISKWEPSNDTSSIPLYLPTQVSKLHYPTETCILVDSSIKRIPKRLPFEWVTAKCWQRLFWESSDCLGTLLLSPEVCLLIPTCVLVLACESAVATLELAETVWLLVSGGGCVDRGRSEVSRTEEGVGVLVAAVQPFE